MANEYPLRSKGKSTTLTGNTEEHPFGSDRTIKTRSSYTLVRHPDHAERLSEALARAQQHFQQQHPDGDIMKWHIGWMDEWFSVQRAAGWKFFGWKQYYSMDPLDVPLHAIDWMIEWSELGFTPESYHEMMEARKKYGDTEYYDFNLSPNYNPKIKRFTRLYGMHGWKKYIELRKILTSEQAVLTLIGVEEHK